MRNLLGVGVHLLVLTLLLEILTLAARRWVSWSIPLRLETQVLLSVPLVAACLPAARWFHRSLDLVRVHLLNGERHLIPDGPFAYVRHPLYAALLLTLPPLAIVWFRDLVFVIPWAATIAAAHYVVRLEERGLIAEFEEEGYRRYRRAVPARLPYRGAAGRDLQPRENAEEAC
jgi:protein-S-isoprenylcysteine O-methyltransferase Ste14